jgi:hypothetical protein
MESALTRKSCKEVGFVGGSNTNALTREKQEIILTLINILRVQCMCVRVDKIVCLRILNFFICKVFWFSHN